MFEETARKAREFVSLPDIFRLVKLQFRALMDFGQIKDPESRVFSENIIDYSSSGRMKSSESEMKLLDG